MTARILVLPGDGVGPEILAEAVKVLECLRQEHGLNVVLEHGLLGRCAMDEFGSPYPEATRRQVRTADAVLLGPLDPLGRSLWNDLDPSLRLAYRTETLCRDVHCFISLNPIRFNASLAAVSPLKPEWGSGLNVLIVSELTEGLVKGDQLQGIRLLDKNGERETFDALYRRESAVERIAQWAFTVAQQRSRKVWSITHDNELTTTGLWQEVMNRFAQNYPDVGFSQHEAVYTFWQLLRAPRQFDVLVAEGLVGRLFVNSVAALTGAIGMLPVAFLNPQGQGLYQPLHGADLGNAGQGIANPLGAILAVALLLRYSLRQLSLAERVEQAVEWALARGLRTLDMTSAGMTAVGTQAMGDAVIAALDRTSD